MTPRRRKCGAAWILVREVNNRCVAGRQARYGARRSPPRSRTTGGYLRSPAKRAAASATAGLSVARIRSAPVSAMIAAACANLPGTTGTASSRSRYPARAKYTASFRVETVRPIAVLSVASAATSSDLAVFRCGRRRTRLCRQCSRMRSGCARADRGRGAGRAFRARSRVSRRSSPRIRRGRAAARGWRRRNPAAHHRPAAAPCDCARRRACRHPWRPAHRPPSPPRTACAPDWCPAS